MTHPFLELLGGVQLETRPLNAPIPQHTKRSNQSEAYHRRIQKKWDKRYGSTVPTVHLATGTIFGAPISMVVTPDMADSLNLLKELL